MESSPTWSYKIVFFLCSGFKFCFRWFKIWGPNLVAILETNLGPLNPTYRLGPACCSHVWDPIWFQIWGPSAVPICSLHLTNFRFRFYSFFFSLAMLSLGFHLLANMTCEEQNGLRLPSLWCLRTLPSVNICNHCSAHVALLLWWSAAPCLTSRSLGHRSSHCSRNSCCHNRARSPRHSRRRNRGCCRSCNHNHNRNHIMFVSMDIARKSMLNTLRKPYVTNQF